VETIYFLIFIGVCAFVVVWKTRRPKSQTDLSGKNKTKYGTSTEKLARPIDNRLSHREQIWQARQKRTTKTFVEKPTFVPKSLSGSDPEYDGYSRRDRHHLTPSGHVKEDAHVEGEAGLAMTAVKLESDGYPANTKPA
jgi:hypothetical protein